MSAVLDNAVALIFRSTRMIADIVPDCVVEAVHDDRLSITMHPVERGANVSDHAFVMPRTVEMRLGFSDSTQGWVGAAAAGYAALLALQSERSPFTVSSGQRLYDNMLVAGVTQVDDKNTKHTKMVTVRLQQVRIANVQSKNGTSVRDQQSMPQSTAPQANVGSVQTSAVKAGPR